MRRLFLTKLSLARGNAEYRIETANEEAIVYARTYRPYWMVRSLLCWLVFPLLPLLVEQTDRIVLTLLPDAPGTRVVGDGPGAMRRQFEDLGDTGLDAQVTA